MYKIFIKKKTLKNLSKLPENIQKKFALLSKNLREEGPIAYQWPNYSKIGESKYHCHLAHSFVACWYMEKGTIKIEVYYVGSRENAPY